MVFYFTLPALIPLSAVILSLIISIALLTKLKKTPLLYSVLSLHGIAVLWSLGKTFELISLTTDGRLLSQHIMYTAIDFAPANLLVFCWIYCNSKHYNKRNLTLLLLPPLLIHTLFLTTGYHHLYFAGKDFRQVGIIFYLNVIIGSSYVLAGLVELIKYYREQSRILRRPIRLVIWAFLIPFIIGLLETVNLLFFQGRFAIHHFTTYSFTISILLTSVAVYKYQFLNTIPIALRTIVDHLKEIIIVTNNQNRIINFNQAFLNYFPTFQWMEKNLQIKDFVHVLYAEALKIPATEKIMAALKDPLITNYSNELSIGSVEPRYFYINIRPILTESEQLLGRVISCTDITDYKLTLEELAVMKERNRFVRDVHDSLGQSMSLLINQLDICLMEYQRNPENIEDKLISINEIARAGMNEIRDSIRGLTPEKLSSDHLKKALEELANSYRVTGMRVNLTFDEIPATYTRNYQEVIYRICQEALTNSLRHGQATETDIILRFNGQNLGLFIFNNGKGCTEIIPGYGLTGMAQRVWKLNGNIVFGSDGQKGFNIHVEIPVLGITE